MYVIGFLAYNSSGFCDYLKLFITYTSIYRTCTIIFWKISRPNNMQLLKRHVSVDEGRIADFAILFPRSYWTLTQYLPLKIRYMWIWPQFVVLLCSAVVTHYFLCYRRPSHWPRRHYVFNLSAHLCVRAPPGGDICRSACCRLSLLWARFCSSSVCACQFIREL